MTTACASALPPPVGGGNALEVHIDLLLTCGKSRTPPYGNTRLGQRRRRAEGIARPCQEPGRSRQRIRDVTHPPVSTRCYPGGRGGGQSTLTCPWPLPDCRLPTSRRARRALLKPRMPRLASMRRALRPQCACPAWSFRQFLPVALQFRVTLAHLRSCADPPFGGFCRKNAGDLRARS